MTTAIPRELTSVPNWIVWRYEHNEDGKATKVPYRPRSPRVHASATDRATWTSYQFAASVAAKDPTIAGVGWVFADGEDITGIDLDACIDPETGLMEAWADELVDAFDTYTEISPSGTGVKLWCHGTTWHNGKRNVHLELPEWEHGKARAIEVYSKERYFCVTGKPWPGTRNTLEGCQDQLDALCAWLFPPVEPRVAPVQRRPITLSDREILDHAYAASNGANIRALFESGDCSPYGGDESAADMALVSHLAFWAGADAARIDQLFRSSALYRPKWDARRGQQTYGQRTIEKALSTAHETYSGPAGNGVYADGPRTWGARAEQTQEQDPASDDEEDGEEEEDEPEPEPPQLPGRVHLWPHMAGAPPDPNWIVEGVILGGMITLLHGEPGCGKTLLAMSYARDLVQAGYPVLLIDEESGVSLVAERFRQMGLSREDVDLIHYYPFAGLGLADTDVLAAYIDAIQPALVAFDSMADVLTVNNLDENKANDVTKWMVSVAVRIARGTRSKPGVLILDHNTKSEETVKYARGSGAKKSKADIAFFVNKVAEFDVNTLGRVRLERTKNRPGYVPNHVLYTVGGGAGQLVCRPFDTSTDDTVSEGSRDGEVLTLLRDAGPEGLSNSQLQGALTLGHNAVWAIVNRLEKAGQVSRAGAGRSVRYYYMDIGSNHPQDD